MIWIIILFVLPVCLALIKNIRILWKEVLISYTFFLLKNKTKILRKDFLCFHSTGLSKHRNSRLWMWGLKQGFIRGLCNCGFSTVPEVPKAFWVRLIQPHFTIRRASPALGSRFSSKPVWFKRGYCMCVCLCVCVIFMELTSALSLSGKPCSGHLMNKCSWESQSWWLLCFISWERHINVNITEMFTAVPK